MTSGDEFVSKTGRCPATGRPPSDPFGGEAGKHVCPLGVHFCPAPAHRGHLLRQAPRSSTPLRHCKPARNVITTAHCSGDRNGPARASPPAVSEKERKKDSPGPGRRDEIFSRTRAGLESRFE
ncbi:hypothetical protein HPB50_021961 [Hyalomma asiaticum]|uniref:Uncharacterized protein n=1 Tax=Hyalomma asiaticum TaxID=266040 RepID=A0ACB7TNS4_HYAAI|nr:hypothetical protein HPB50_021961 [Hyalomma asiaticum]